MNYYSHNIGDYAQATMHLNLVEDAIYSRLLRRYYSEEQPIIDDIQQVCRWVGARTQEEREAVPVILAEFFELVDGYWRNKRADEEIAAYQSKSAKAAGSAAKRWGGSAKAKPSVCEGNANAMPTHSEGNANQEPITNNQETDKKNTPPTPRKRGAEKVVVHTVSSADLQSLGIPADVAAEFLALRQRKRAALTEIALAGIRREADSIGWTLEQALRKSIERGWQSFDASWVQGQNARTTGQPMLNKQEALEERNREIALRWAERSVG